ncbi:MAG: hypothetical protein ABEI58_02445 [Candidatus Nanohaloarchaea archaeon]
MSESGSWFEEHVKPWFEFPDPENNPKDNVWSDFHIFNNEWVEVQSRLEWYESPNVPSIYEEHKYILQYNMGMNRPEELYYKQNVDSNDFRSHMDDTEELPSGRGKLRLKLRIRTKSAPSGENNFAMVQYLVDTKVKYDIPKGITFLPRFLARPLNKLFRKAFFKYIGEEMIERDGEYAIEKTREYFQYIRKYHGEEPIQTKSRQAEFKPVPEEGIFFQ